MAAAGDPSPVRARLVADTARIEPGDTVSIGVLFDMEPGWHIYWRNPGDSGLATDVRLTLPDGLEAGELRWPAPIRFVQPGNLTAYGYEGSVLLAADVGVSGAPESQTPSLGAKVSWLACREVCVLGSASLDEDWPLPVAEDAFDRWRSQLPGNRPPFTITTAGGLQDEARTGSLSVWLQWTEPPAEIQFFPDPGDRLKVANVTVRTRGTLTRVDLDIKVLGPGATAPEGLTAVVASGGHNTTVQSWEIEVPFVE